MRGWLMSKLSNEPQILTLDRPISHSRPHWHLFYLALYFATQHLVSPNKSKLILTSASAPTFVTHNNAAHQRIARSPARTLHSYASVTALVLIPGTEISTHRQKCTVGHRIRTEEQPVVMVHTGRPRVHTSLTLSLAASRHPMPCPRRRCHRLLSHPVSRHSVLTNASSIISHNLFTGTSLY